MEYRIETVLGPRTASVKREVALEQLQTHKDYPKGAILSDFGDEDGRWVAKLKVPVEASTKKAEFPFPPKGESDDSESESAPPSPDEKPPSDSEESEDSEDTNDDSKSEGDSDEGESKKSLEDTVADLEKVINAIADKLGVDTAGEDSPVPGEDELGLGPDVPPVDGPPAGHAPPAPKAPAGPKGPSKLRPGELPNVPGVTPVGAPAFASTQGSIPEDHPFRQFIGKVASFRVSDETDISVAQAHEELTGLVEPYGYKVKRARAATNDDGKREVRALISKW